MNVRTHLGIDAALCGTVVQTGDGTAEVRLTTTSAMAADDQGLVHGGFVFGQVDYAAMVAVNDPNVVLGAADVRFVAPVRVGEVVVARATRSTQKGRKHVIEVVASVGERVVVTGTLTTFVLDQHVLEATPAAR